MAEKELRVHGVPQPKGLSWLKEVQVDAARAAIQHLTETKERQEFEAAKARGITPKDILEQGKRKLGLSGEEADDFEETDDSPAKPLNKMTKDELLDVADDEDVDVDDSATVPQLRAAIEAKRKENE